MLAKLPMCLVSWDEDILGTVILSRAASDAKFRLAMMAKLLNGRLKVGDIFASGAVGREVFRRHHSSAVSKVSAC